MNAHVVLEKPGIVRRPPPSPLPPVRPRPFVLRENQRALFADSLLESTSGQRARRTWATVASFVFECLLIVVALLIPLYYTEVLPTQQLLTFLVAPPPPPPPPPPAAAAAAAKPVRVTSEVINGRLRMPASIPTRVQMIKEEEAPAPAGGTGGVVGGVPGGIPGGQIGGVIGGIISSTSNLAAVPKLAKPAANAIPPRVRVSQGVTKGMLTSKIEPAYPTLAREARVQGIVVLTAIIDKEGNVVNLQLVSGHPMLAPAAIDAVRQWHYKPYLLSGVPVEVETTITVTFQLQQ